MYREMSSNVPISIPYGGSPHKSVNNTYHIDPKIFQSSSPKYSPGISLGNILSSTPGSSRLLQSGTPKSSHNFPTVVDIIPEAVAKPIHSIYPQLIDEAKSRANYIIKFGILRKNYPHIDIPNVRDDQSLDEIDVIFREYTKIAHIEESVEQNKNYLFMFWLVLEFLAVKYLKLPVRGYTENQLKYLGKYQLLLIELAERSYNSTIGDTWGVETRLFIASIFNGFLFLIIQILSSTFGKDQANKVTEMLTEQLTGSKGKNVIRQMEEANVDNQKPVDQTAKTPTDPMGGFGSMISQFMPMVSGFFNQGGTGDKPSDQPEPKPKRPSRFGSKN